MNLPRPQSELKKESESSILSLTRSNELWDSLLPAINCVSVALARSCFLFFVVSRAPVPIKESESLLKESEFHSSEHRDAYWFIVIPERTHFWIAPTMAPLQLFHSLDKLFCVTGWNSLVPVQSLFHSFPTRCGAARSKEFAWLQEDMGKHLSLVLWEVYVEATFHLLQ